MTNKLKCDTIADMSTAETNKISNIGRNNPEAIANEVGLRDLDIPQRPLERTPSMLPRIALVGAVAGTAAWLFAPKHDDAPDPTPPTYSEQAEQSAEHPYDPAKDTLIVDDIKVMPNNSHKDTPSEAVLNNEEVNQYIDTNPDESTSLYASATSLDDHPEYAVVERDIDGDGDKDAVAVPVDEK